MFNLMKLHSAESISIPVVQELAAKDPYALPQRYIRAEEERPPCITTNTNLITSIPIIDMELLSGDDECRQIMMDNLASACKEWGFFQVVNHGVAGSVLEQMKRDVRGFFLLPLEEKLKYVMKGGGEGYGQTLVFSDDQKLDWSDIFVLRTLPQDGTNMDFWPTKPVDFRATVDTFSKEIEKLSDRLLRLIAETLGIKSNSFENGGRKWEQAIRMNYHPRCPRPDLVLGISPHSDASAITILLQDDEVTGLHIRKAEEWVPVQPIPGALVINIGDIVQVMSNGRYKSIEHRAVPNDKRDRISIATVALHSKNAQVGPHPDLVDATHPALYRTFNLENFRKSLSENKQEGKSALQFCKIQSLP
ncbi:hypothetical protein KI387_038579 [Taxus chinensis]|uniref:Fe2OG dioxygenase domain-containing protein n=1 Tax=Taxus chinensis TaxID=29808 RepID=A0AA38C9A4_TAXCH|nr:hypothetical protein KI387_038579 [Taxus chinensis]